MVVRVRVRVYSPTNLSKYCFLISAPTSQAHAVGVCVYVSTFEALAMALVSEDGESLGCCL